MRSRRAAALVYFSICNQLDEKDEFVVSLDSSQARYNPLYWRTLVSALTGILERRSKQVQVQLLEPIGTVSVPQIGAARAVNDFLN